MTMRSVWRWIAHIHLNMRGVTTLPHQSTHDGAALLALLLAFYPLSRQQLANPFDVFCSSLCIVFTCATVNACLLNFCTQLSRRCITALKLSQHRL